jgi:hypothetical protein
VQSSARLWCNNYSSSLITEYGEGGMEGKRGLANESQGN